MCCLFDRIHPDTECTKTTDEQEAVLRSKHAACRVLDEMQLFAERIIFNDDKSSDDVRVSADVFRRTVQDDVCTEREWLLMIWSRERVVDDEFKIVTFGNRCDRCDVRYFQQRVRRCFDVDDLRVVLDRCFRCRKVRRIDECHLDVELW